MRFGIDVASRRPRHLDDVAGHRFTHVITLCDKAREALEMYRDATESEDPRAVLFESAKGA